MIRVSSVLKTFSAASSGRNMIRKCVSSSGGKLIHSEKNKLFSLELSDGAAIVQYSINSAGEINLDHTEVPEVFKGKGVGSILAKEVFDYLKANDTKAHINCSFLENYVKKHPEYQEIIIEN